MNFVYYAIVSLIFIVLQTTVLPGSFFFSRCFDLIVLIVLHISLAYANPGVLAGMAVLGCIMDSISGGPLGLYISAYVWIFVLVQVCKGFVHSENIIFLFIVSGAAVLLENGFQVFAFMVQGGGGRVFIVGPGDNGAAGTLGSCRPSVSNGYPDTGPEGIPAFCGKPFRQGAGVQQIGGVRVDRKNT
ncbi:MAG: hypothetical protein V1793_01690 [Pseudomonadota bacterium]